MTAGNHLLKAQSSPQESFSAPIKASWCQPTIKIFESFDTAGEAKAPTGNEADPNLDGPS
jgi:hypothetical protein